MPYKNIEIVNAKSTTAQSIQQSQFYMGFSTVNNSDPGNRLYDFDLVKQDLINHFNTRKGERAMNPNFGSIIWDLLMEPLTDQTRIAIQDDITSICNADPRIHPTEIQITEYDSGYLLELTLILSATNQSANLTLAFDQQIGLVVQ